LPGPVYMTVQVQIDLVVDQKALQAGSSRQPVVKALDLSRRQEGRVMSDHQFDIAGVPSDYLSAVNFQVAVDPTSRGKQAARTGCFQHQQQRLSAEIQVTDGSLATPFGIEGKAVGEMGGQAVGVDGIALVSIVVARGENDPPLRQQRFQAAAGSSEFGFQRQRGQIPGYDQNIPVARCQLLEQSPTHRFTEMSSTQPSLIESTDDPFGGRPEPTDQSRQPEAEVGEMQIGDMDQTEG